MKEFSEPKHQLLQYLDQFEQKLKQIEVENEMVFNSDLSERIDKARQNLLKQVVKVVMFGSFSDGKSTILSAITGDLDILIAPEPSTKEISPPHLWGDYEIVDTPGLFSENVPHDEVTCQFISEANLILYTLEPRNPLKESHRETVIWLLRDLGKLDCTIFVLNKMDSVADLESEKGFARCCQVKVESVRSTLSRFLGTRVDANVVCVAADPFGRGLKNWLGHKDYARLSRLPALEQEIEAIVRQTKESLIVNAGLSVLLDTAQNVSKRIDEVVVDNRERADAWRNQVKELKRELGRLEEDIVETHRQIVEELSAERKQLILALRSAENAERLRDVIAVHIGDDAHILNSRMQSILEKHTKSIWNAGAKAAERFEESVRFHEEMYTEVYSAVSRAGAKVGEQIVKTDLEKLTEAVKRVRDIVKRVTGKNYKFKPHQAKKLANTVKGFGRWLQALPLLTESIDGLCKLYSDSKFKKERDKVCQWVTDVFQEFRTDITADRFAVECFPAFRELREVTDSYVTALANMEQRIEGLRRASAELGQLEVEFRQHMAHGGGATVGAF